MPALRPRTVFAATFVITVACSKKDAAPSEPTKPEPVPMEPRQQDASREGFSSTWVVSKNDNPLDPPGSCRALVKVYCDTGAMTGSGRATCNPPSPEAIPCPPGVEHGVRVGKKVYSDTDCWLLPDGCEYADCATQKVRCPWTYDERTRLMRTGKKDADGRCLVSWSPPYSTPLFVIPCPAGVGATFQITRADFDKPCMLAGPTPTEIPCPVEPVLFSDAQAFQKVRADHIGARIQTHATGKDLAALGCGADEPMQTSLVVDGRVTKAGTLEDCAIWVY